MDLISIPEGTYDIGWRRKPEGGVLESIEEFVELAELVAVHSPPRTVKLAAFEITSTCIKLSDLVDTKPEAFEHVDSLAEYCDAADSVLAEWGFRLPTEDEFEVAFGPTMFPWGEEMPEGIPHSNQTKFRAHFQPSLSGLSYNPSTYVGELVRTAIKLSDGGSAVCGGYPWPVPWLCFNPAYRIGQEVEFLHEHLEDAEVRRVKLKLSS